MFATLTQVASISESVSHAITNKKLLKWDLFSGTPSTAAQAGRERQNEITGD